LYVLSPLRVSDWLSFQRVKKKVDFNAGKKEKKNRRDDEEEQEGGQQEFLYAYTLLQSKKLQ
jgi:hypothetical protein